MHSCIVLHPSTVSIMTNKTSSFVSARVRFESHTGLCLGFAGLFVGGDVFPGMGMECDGIKGLEVCLMLW